MPTFFLVGAAGSGTTSLYEYLGQHPEIYTSPLKCPSYFAADIRPEGFWPDFQRSWAIAQRGLDEYLDGPMRKRRAGQVFTWGQYLKLFKNVRDEKAIGEASVAYLWSETAARDIRRTLPTAKILIVLRDPVERAFTGYCQARVQGWLRLSFREAIDADLRQGRNRFGVSLLALEAGLYHAHVKRFLEHFPAEQVRVYLYEQYATDPVGMLRDIFSFLGVDPSFTPDLSVRAHRSRTPRLPATLALAARVVRPAVARRMIPGPLWTILRTVLYRSERPLMEPEDRASLLDYYRNDVRLLSELLARDLTHWLRDPAAVA